MTYPIAGWLGAANLTAATIALLTVAALATTATLSYTVVQRLRTSSDGPTPVPEAASTGSVSDR